MNRNLLLLTRHAAAEKNRLGQFSGSSETDRLTEEGEQQLGSLSSEIELLVRTLAITNIGIAHAPSGRAQATASSLHAVLGVRSREVAGFRSIRSGIAAGMTETEIAKANPEFARALSLYRAGVLSSYQIPYPEGAEPVSEFEFSVIKALGEFTAALNRDLDIVVAHRSSITSILLHYARLAHSYPEEFFGYISLDPCVTSCVDVTPGRERILWVNTTITIDLIERLAMSRPNFHG